MASSVRRLLLVSLALTVEARFIGIPSLSSLFRREAAPEPAQVAQDSQFGCPAIWTTIAMDLRTNLTKCNDLSRSALRFAFHDAAGYSINNIPYAPASGGADGSLLLNDLEAARIQSAPLNDFRTSYLLPTYNKYSDQVSAADFVQFAGSIGTQSCPGGTIYKTVVGRNDSSLAAPDGLLPVAFGPGSDYDTLIQLWADKGFSPRELVALLGAHTTSEARAQQIYGIPTGGPQDSTPTDWDINYYSQTQAEVAPAGVYRFDSDVNLAANPNSTAGAAFTEFAGDFPSWAGAFADAMYKLSVLGIPANVSAQFYDCTAVATLVVF